MHRLVPKWFGGELSYYVGGAEPMSVLDQTIHETDMFKRGV